MVKLLTYIFIAIVFFYPNIVKSQDDWTFTVGLDMHASNLADKYGIFGGFNMGYIYENEYFASLSLNNLSFTNLSASFKDTISGNSPSVNIDYYSIELGKSIYTHESHTLLLSCQLSIAFIEYNSSGFTFQRSGEVYSPDFGSDNFFFIEPKLNWNINWSNWLLSNFYAGYRLTYGLDYRVELNQKIDIWQNENLNGAFLGVQVRFGDFK